MTHSPVLYAVVGLVACLVTLLLVPAFRALAWRLDVVDRPSDPRKVHARIIPYLGGLPFYLGFLVTVLLVEGFYPQYSQPMFYPMCVVGTLIVLMGIYDDICDMGSLKKLIIELILMSLLFYWGFRTTEIASPFGGTFSLGWLAFIITPLWVAGVINAVNFSDGLDGLASGLVFICAASIFAIGYKNGQVASCILMAYLMGTTLGFLRYNFNPASIFMGDAGALFLGFVLGAATLVENQKGVTTIALSVPMVVMAIPILDTLLSFYRRLQRARDGRFFTPDRNHLHHRLLDLGLTQRQVVLSLYYISASMGVLAFVLSVLPPDYGFLILLLAAMGIMFGVVILRFIEGFAHRDP
jgi:UDP-GlcNAc:undecaprenyl-phosphate GlcNAc-1-phosphate transferase